jgi:hypothetical protein
MFTSEFEVALYAVALALPLNGMDCDDPDLMDIEGLCVSLDEYDYDTMASAIDFESFDYETECVGE